MRATRPTSTNLVNGMIEGEALLDLDTDRYLWLRACLVGSRVLQATHLLGGCRTRLQAQDYSIQQQSGSSSWQLENEWAFVRRHIISLYNNSKLSSFNLIEFSKTWRLSFPYPASFKDAFLFRHWSVWCATATLGVTYHLSGLSTGRASASPPPIVEMVNPMNSLH